MMRLDTLSSRLVLYLTLVTILAVLLSAFVIASDYRRNAEKRFSDVVTANVYALMAGMASEGLDANGKLAGRPQLGESRFNQYNSGWYWSVTSINEPNNTD